MAERKKRNIRKTPLRSFKWLKWVLITVVILGIAFVVTAKPVFNIDLMEKLKRNGTESSSEAILVRAHDLFLFQTVEYVYKTVFPFDFVPAVYDWRALLDKHVLGQELTAKEKEYLSIYRFCEDLGIQLQKNKFDFVVITSVVRGGFNLEGTVYENPEQYGDGEYREIQEYVRIEEETQTLYLRLPPPVITHFEIEDPDRATYPYPDFEISPENWKYLTQFTANKIEQQVLEDGILELAKQKGSAFIEKILIDAGLQKVVFLDPL